MYPNIGYLSGSARLSEATHGEEKQSPAGSAEESAAVSRRLATRGKRRPALGVVETAQRYYLARPKMGRTADGQSLEKTERERASVCGALRGVPAEWGRRFFR